MRMMMKAHLNVEAANVAIRDGSLARAVEGFMAKVRPEAAYFMVDAGRRTMLAVFEMTETSLIPELAEPFFQDLGAELAFLPVMNAAELQAGLSAWAATSG